MAPKEASKAAKESADVQVKATKPKPASAAPAHASYQDMIKDAILKLKERNGSSRQAIKKYIKANNNLGSATENQFTTRLSRAIKTGVDSGVFDQPKGASGPLKLKKPGAKASKSAKPKAEKKEGDADKKPAAKKTSEPKPDPKPAEPKKAPEKPTKAATKKAAPKKTEPAAAKKSAEKEEKAKPLKAKAASVTKTKAAPKKAAATPTKKTPAPKKATA